MKCARQPYKICKFYIHNCIIKLKQKEVPAEKETLQKIAEGVSNHPLSEANGSSEPAKVLIYFD